jgi:hypothetical protein
VLTLLDINPPGTGIVPSQTFPWEQNSKGWGKVLNISAPLSPTTKPMEPNFLHDILTILSLDGVNSVCHSTPRFWHGCISNFPPWPRFWALERIS